MISYGGNQESYCHSSGKITEKNISPINITDFVFKTDIKCTVFLSQA